MSILGCTGTVYGPAARGHQLSLTDADWPAALRR